MKKLILISAILFLQACGTIMFNPPVYELAETTIPDFNVAGNVKIVNVQDSSEPAIIHSYGGTKYESNYKTITETMVTQAYFELERHGKNSGGDTDKQISLSVTHLQSKYIAFYWKGTMTFSVSLGDGEQFEITVKHGTGAGAAQDLSGSIADGVAALFKHEDVKAYLAK